MPIKMALKGTGGAEPWTLEVQVASGLSSRLAAGGTTTSRLLEPATPSEESDLARDTVDSKTRADVVLAWRRGDVKLPAAPKGTHLEDDADSAFVRLVWSSVELTAAEAAPDYKLGWKGALVGLTAAKGAGDQLISAWFGAPGVTLEQARGHDTVLLKGAGLEPLWLRAVKSFFSS